MFYNQSIVTNKSHGQLLSELLTTSFLFNENGTQPDFNGWITILKQQEVKVLQSGTVIYFAYKICSFASIRTKTEPLETF